MTDAANRNPARAEREKRLAQALKANLKRRKSRTPENSAPSPKAAAAVAPGEDQK